MASKKRVLVIGAGASGLTSIKTCKEESFDVVCYERTGDFGGLWRYHEDQLDGLPSVMKSTITNISKEMSSFSDFPFPAHFPAYMHHSLVLKYLEMYAEHFDLLSCVLYYHEVTNMVPAEDYGTTGRWLITVRDLNADHTREEIFDGVIVCVGHHAYPSMPSYPGQDLFTGTLLHSHKYKTFTGLEDKVVLVVGAGNSGADIAVELSNYANKVFLSTRRGAWIYPRMMKKGKPFDILLHRRSNALYPKSYLNWKLEKVLNSRMDHARFGIRPYHEISSQHPTINDDLHARILTGLVTIKKDVKEFAENGVLFDGDAHITPVDAVIFATGFNIKLPFISEDILRVSKNKVFLYKNVFPPQLQHPSLGIIGLIQPNGALFPVFEIQARWFASLVSGKARLPNTEVMLREVRSAEDFRARNYVQSPRHTIEASWIEYMDDVGSKIGVKPSLPSLFFRDPKLFWACVRGPCLPYQYRLSGPHSWSGARDAILIYKDRLYKYLRTPTQADNDSG